jgi:cob(I)alamin adenosyltransferase
MKIYTKTGDKGTTSLLGGTRVSKNHKRINAYGTVDELNSFIGLLRDQEVNGGRSGELQHIQERLFTIGSSLASEKEIQHVFKPDIREDDILLLEKAMDAMNAGLPELRNFILPGGHTAVSLCHVARTVCRRAERAVIELAENEGCDENIIIYLNRLSDYFFVLARKIALELGVEEIKWRPRS